MSGFDHQDWETVVIKSKAKATEERKNMYQVFLVELLNKLSF